MYRGGVCRADVAHNTLRPALGPSLNLLVEAPFLASLKPDSQDSPPVAALTAAV